MIKTYWRFYQCSAHFCDNIHTLTIDLKNKEGKKKKKEMKRRRRRGRRRSTSLSVTNMEREKNIAILRPTNKK